MKVYPHLLAVTLAVLSACREVPSTPPSELQPKVEALSLHTVLSNPGDYKDQKIFLAAYLVTHVEGPWICADNTDSTTRLATTLSVKNLDAGKIHLSELSAAAVRAEMDERGFEQGSPESGDIAVRHYAWHTQRWGDGTPVLIDGVFRVGDYSYPNGLDLQKHPFIEITKVVEVAGDDAIWSAAQHNGE